jgi:acetyltransferase-like isoleucine patch superfamily enzyme
MHSWYRYLALSDSPFARLARRIYRSLHEASIPPVLGWAVIPFFLAYRFLHAVYLILFRALVAEPVFRYYCTRVGRNFRSGARIPAVHGEGRILLGDNVRIDGRFLLFFAVRYSELPTLEVGSNTGIGHDCAFTIGKSIRIGDHCRLGSAVRIFDTPGHPVDPEDRKIGKPALQTDVRPITIGNNVWIGSEAAILPGVSIGENSIVASGSVVINEVPANVVVAGNPARIVAKIPAAAIGQ